MKAFSKQYTESYKNGLIKTGQLLKFKDNPNLLPHPMSRASKPIQKALQENPDLGFNEMLCGKFGGKCYSGNEECRKLRGCYE